MGLAFVLGVFSHGLLDYMPHCYPIESRIDAITSLIIMVGASWWAKGTLRRVLIAAFLGSIFPDLIDHSLEIINNLFGWSLPVYDNLFPWHWKKYSGSIYSDECGVSSFNHLMVIIVCLAGLLISKLNKAYEG